MAWCHIWSIICIFVGYACIVCKWLTDFCLSQLKTSYTRKTQNGHSEEMSDKESISKFQNKQLQYAFTGMKIKNLETMVSPLPHKCKYLRWAHTHVTVNNGLMTYGVTNQNKKHYIKLNVTRGTRRINA